MRGDSVQKGEFFGQEQYGKCPSSHNGRKRQFNKGKYQTEDT
jgi:hypothetical protein